MNNLIKNTPFVIPALSRNPERLNWIPAFAGMTLPTLSFLFIHSNINRLILLHCFGFWFYFISLSRVRRSRFQEIWKFFKAGAKMRQNLCCGEVAVE
jgi:hypothetical protein